MLKKGGLICKELYNYLPKKLSLSSQKYGFGMRDPEQTYSGSRIPDPGVKKAPDPGCATLARTSAQPQVNLSLLRGNSLKFQPLYSVHCTMSQLNYSTCIIK
jgi:hypothetical protein